MAINTVLTSFIICGLISTHFVFVHGFRPSFSQEGKSTVESISTEEMVESNNIERQQSGVIMRSGAASFGVENSARKVPTGPDPLHHNNNPVRP